MNHTSFTSEAPIDRNYINLTRSEEPFVRPDLPFETTGQYEDGTTFLEGMVYHNDRWFIYYGAADSRVGVLYWDP